MRLLRKSDKIDDLAAFRGTGTHEAFCKRKHTTNNEETSRNLQTQTEQKPNETTDENKRRKTAKPQEETHTNKEPEIQELGRNENGQKLWKFTCQSNFTVTTQ